MVVNDTSDNTGAGAPGDATHLLRAVLECPDRRAGRDRCVFGQIYDPAIAAAAHERVRVDLIGRARINI